jgi:GT2 family glycosyltransferase
VKPREVSVAILSWNGRQHLETCLAALAAQRDPGVPWETLVLDNGSSDGTAEWLRAAHPRVRLVRSEVNLGFCAGNNRLATAARGDAVAFLNNDTQPEAGWLRALVAALGAAPAEVAAVSGMIVDWGGERLDFAQGVMTFDGHALQPGFRRPLERVAVPSAGSELLFACGGNMLVRKAAFTAAGGFDEDYFAYYEDVDFGWRLWAGGERVTFTPEAVVRHRSSATSDLLGLYNRGFLFERNAFLTAYKNYEPGLWERLFPAVLLTLLARTQTLLVENNPGGELLRLDPYAGLIANTAAGPAALPAGAAPSEGLYAKWRRYGPREFVRRAAARAARAARAMAGGPPPAAAAGPPCLTDERTVAQLRAVGWLLRHLERAAEKRAAVQARRRVSDREIFARFPLYLVPTYPGDAELFASPGFRAWLPRDLPLVEKRLEELMSLD